MNEHRDDFRRARETTESALTEAHTELSGDRDRASLARLEGIGEVARSRADLRWLEARTLFLRGRLEEAARLNQTVIEEAGGLLKSRRTLRGAYDLGAEIAEALGRFD